MWIAAWDGGVIEIDLLPDDGVIHDITTATSYADSILWVSIYFGMSRYDGKNWNGYFDHESCLASNFINFVRDEGSVVFVCCDNGLCTLNCKTWVTCKKNDNDENGKALFIKGIKVLEEIPLSPCFSHNLTVGVYAEVDVLWIATSKGVSRGETKR